MTTMAALKEDLPSISTIEVPPLDASLAWERWRNAYEEWTVALRIVNDLEERSARARMDGMDEDAIRLLYSATALEQREEKASHELALAQDVAVATVPSTIGEALLLATIVEGGELDDDAVPVALSSLVEGLRRLSGS